MAHGTLIGGTAYKVSGGRTLVNGTGYKISKGRTLVGGTGYDISFGIPVTITGKGANTVTCATIHGTQYIAPASVTVEPGDVITFSVHGYNSTNYGEVRINGVQVVKAPNTLRKTYDWTVPDGTATISIVLNKQSSYGRITVTTT